MFSYNLILIVGLALLCIAWPPAAMVALVYINIVIIARAAKWLLNRIFWRY